MGSKQLGSKFLYCSQICSHTPSALNAGAKRSEAERRAIWPCLNVATWRRERNDRAIQKDDKIRPHSIRSLQFDQKVRHLSFRPEKIDLFTATQ